MTEQAKVPAIRFAGFTDPWEQRKLGELMDVASVRRVHQEDWTDEGVRFLRARDLVAFAKNESIEDPLFISSEMYKEYSAQSGKVSVGDLLVTGVGTIGVPWLVTSDNPVYFKDGNIIWFKNRHSIDGGFFYHSFTASAIQNCINEAAGIGTVGTYTIETGKKTPIWLPSRQEQREIAAMMTHLDTLITLHQRKYDKLVVFKKTMLEKMFPKDGESVPEIRFAGFTDPWEQRKFSNLTDRVSMQSSDPDLPQVEYEDIVSGEGTLNKDLRDKEGGKTGIKFYAGDVLYGKLRPYLMNWLYPQFNGVAVGDFWVLRATECDSSFLYRLVQTDGFQRLANVSSGSKMPRADWNLISQSFFAVPADYAEQRVIAKSLAELDDLITLHQRKLELLQNIKKSLLDKMFV